MLQIENLEVKYGDYIAVSSLSMDVAAGGIVALFGANGAGKSSLLNAVAGLIKPSQGRVRFEGRDITGLGADRVARQGLSLVPQGGRCFVRMSVEDNLLIGGYPRQARRHARANLDRVYGIFPALVEKRKALAGTLSGGQRQMLAIGRALMLEPKCVLFDEISLGLAPVVIRELYASICRISRQEGITVVLVEQDMERALRICDKYYVMLKGTITLAGDAQSRRADDIRSAYFGV